MIPRKQTARGDKTPVPEKPSSPGIRVLTEARTDGLTEPWMELVQDSRV